MTDSDPRLYERLLLDTFPDGFFPAWIEQIQRAYREAHHYCEGRLRKEEAHDLLGHLRRALAEDGTQRVANRFAPAVACTAHQNAAPNYYHRVLSCGRLRLVEGYSQSAKDVLRSAKHRREYAGSQGEFWPSMVPAVPLAAERDAIFGIIQHGAHPEDRCIPGYVKVFFPTADCDRYVTGVDLLSRFPPDNGTAQEESVADDVPMSPRRKRKEEHGA